MANPHPSQELRGFLGLSGYYRKFIWRYAAIAKPLTDQLKKDAFGWTEQATEAFGNLKTAITQAPVLVLPDFAKICCGDRCLRYWARSCVNARTTSNVFFSKNLGVRAQLKPIYE